MKWVVIVLPFTHNASFDWAIEFCKTIQVGNLVTWISGKDLVWSKVWLNKVFHGELMGAKWLSVRSSLKFYWASFCLSVRGLILPNQRLNLPSQIWYLQDIVNCRTQVGIFDAGRSLGFLTRACYFIQSSSWSCPQKSVDLRLVWPRSSWELTEYKQKLKMGQRDAS